MQITCIKCQKLFSFEKLAKKENCPYCKKSQKTPKDPWTPGVVLGFRYKIIQEIGKGGHGVICLVRDILEEKNYAIKVFYASSLNEERAKSFLQEAQFARNFVHANIVRTYGGGSDGNVFYIIQSWICGVDLIRYEKNIGKFSVEQACYIMLKIANALQFIWDNFSIIHRDIKPANILIDVNGTVLLTDFGIMMPSYEDDETDDLQCTPDYVSPEAATGDASVDIRSDFYSLGATFYRLINGQKPFRGRTAEDVIIQRLEGSPPRLSDKADVPESFSDIILKLMQYNKNDRFQNADELKVAIEKCLELVNKKLKIKKHVDV